jgi:hypothetical protein
MKTRDLGWWVAGVFAVVAMLAYYAMEAQVRQDVPGSAPPRQAAGSVALTVPDGWTRLERGSIVSFAPAADPGGVALHLPPGEDLAGDFARWFDQRWRALLSQYPPVEAGEPNDLQPPGMRARMAMAALHDVRDAPFMVMLLAVSAGSRAQPVLVTFRDSEAMTRHNAEVQAALESVRLLPPSQLPPPETVELASLLAGASAFANLAGTPSRPSPDDARTSPERLRNTIWLVASYTTPGRPEEWAHRLNPARIDEKKRLAFGVDGTYSYEEEDVAEKGTYEIRGDQMVFRRTQGARRLPATRTYGWRFGPDPDMVDLGERVPLSNQGCPRAAHCFSMLYLRGPDGREEIWRPHRP